MKRGLLILVLTLLGNCLLAQQLPQYSQYSINDYAINPAIAGSRSKIEAKSSHRYQWVGVTDAPRTFVLSINGPLKNKNVGFGSYLFTDIVGPTRRSGLYLSYAYHLTLGAARLSFGLSGGLLQYTVDESQIQLESYDPIYKGTVQSKLLPDAGFGTYLYGKNYYFGFSAPQILRNGLDFGKDTLEIGRLVNHFFLTGGYQYKINDDITLEPSFLVKYLSPVPLQYDLTLRAIYQNKYWAGASYRSGDAISVLAGYEFNNGMALAYSFDLPISPIKQVTNASHEIMLMVKFGKKEN